MKGELQYEIGLGLHAEFKPKGLFTLIGESATDRVGGSESNVCGLKTSDGEGETEIFKHIQNAYNRQTDIYDGYKESWAESKLPTPENGESINYNG